MNCNFRVTSLLHCLIFCPQYHKVSSYTEPKKIHQFSVRKKCRFAEPSQEFYFISMGKVLFCTLYSYGHKQMNGINYRHQGGKTSPTWKEFAIALLVCCAGVWNKDEVPIIKDLKILKEWGGIVLPGTWRPVSKGKEIEICLPSSVLVTWLPNSVL